MQERPTGILLLFLLLVVASDLAGRERVRIATYNVRNYLSMDRNLEGRYRLDYPKPEAEKEVVRRIIREVAPDILALQEVGSEAYLLELREDLAREGLVYAGHALLSAADDTRHVAALWRRGWSVGAVGHTDLDFPFFDRREPIKRGMLQLDVSSDGIPSFTVFVLHLKSKYTVDSRDPQSEERRTREAQAARDRILEIFPNPAESLFVVAGDLNDGPSSRAVRRFLARGDLTIARAIESRDEQGLIWTYFYQKGGQYSQIDYLLLSEAWFAQEQPQGHIVDDPDYYQGSDHRLVWADLLLPE